MKLLAPQEAVQLHQLSSYKLLTKTVIVQDTSGNNQLAVNEEWCSILPLVTTAAAIFNLLLLQKTGLKHETNE
jgi:hypothetical protein